MTFNLYNMRGKRFFIFYFTVLLFKLHKKTNLSKLLHIHVNFFVFFFSIPNMTFIFFFASGRLVVPHTINKSGYSDLNKDEVCKNNAEL